MDYKKYYQNNETFHTETNYRLRKITSIVAQIKPTNVLDIGCGNGLLLGMIASEVKAKLYGVDVYEQAKNVPFDYKAADITQGLPYGDNEFGCVILAEVIEHLPDPDFVLAEIRRVLEPGGTLIVSTPNLVSWANRILVLFGVQPLFTETSTQMNLGRKLKALGQGGKVQGHLKIFTHLSLKEILILNKFKLTRRYGTPFFFPFPVSIIDNALKFVIPLASDLVYVAEKTQ